MGRMNDERSFIFQLICSSKSSVKFVIHQFY